MRSVPRIREEHGAHFRGSRGMEGGRCRGCVMIAVLLAVTGCEPSVRNAPGPATGPAPRPRAGVNQIALVGASENDPAWEIMKAVGARLQRERSDVVFTFHAARRASPNAQQQVLDGLRGSADRAVVVMPLDATSIAAQIDALSMDGKLVVVLGTDVPNSKRVAFVGPTAFSLGEATARACATVTPAERRTVMVLHAGRDDEVYGPRIAGFRLQAEAESGLEIFKALDCGANPMEARRIVRRQMRLYPRLGCWAFLDDWPLRHFPSDERLAPIGCAVVVCRDNPAYFDAVREGELHALIGYDLFTCVERGCEMAIRIADDRESEMFDIFTLPPEIITIDNLSWHEERWRTWRSGHAAAAPSTG